MTTERPSEEQLRREAERYLSADPVCRYVVIQIDRGEEAPPEQMVVLAEEVRAGRRPASRKCRPAG